MFDQRQGGKDIRSTNIEAYDGHKLFVAIAVGLAHGEVMLGPMNSSAADVMKGRRRVARRWDGFKKRCRQERLRWRERLLLQRLVDGDNAKEQKKEKGGGGDTECDQMCTTGNMIPRRSSLVLL